MTPLEELPPICKTSDVCAYLRISVPTFYELVRSGRLAHFRVASAIRVSRQSVLNYVSEQEGRITE